MFLPPEDCELIEAYEDPDTYPRYERDWPESRPFTLNELQGQRETARDLFLVDYEIALLTRYRKGYSL